MQGQAGCRAEQHTSSKAVAVAVWWCLPAAALVYLSATFSSCHKHLSPEPVALLAQQHPSPQLDVCPPLLSPAAAKPSPHLWLCQARSTPVPASTCCQVPASVL